MIYPPFAMDEFNCLKPNLSGPKAMWKYRELERKLAKHESDAQSSEKRFMPNKDIRQLIEDEILASKTEKTGLETADKIHFIVEEIKSLVEKRRQYDKNHEEFRYRELIAMVKNMYSTFDIEQFKKDFSAAYPAKKMGDNEKAHGKAIRDAEKQRDKIDREYDWAQHFRSIPNSWRGLSRNVIGENKMAETICRKFLETWSERQEKFAYAVTVNGTLIESLPDEKKKLWSGVWKEFDMDKIRRSDIFRHIIHNQVTPPSPPAPQTIPKEFHKVD